MKQDNLPIEDDLRPEYDLKELRVRRLGSEIVMDKLKVKKVREIAFQQSTISKSVMLFN